MATALSRVSPRSMERVSAVAALIRTHAVQSAGALNRTRRGGVGGADTRCVGTASVARPSVKQFSDRRLRCLPRLIKALNWTRAVARPKCRVRGCGVATKGICATSFSGRHDQTPRAYSRASYAAKHEGELALEVFAVGRKGGMQRAPHQRGECSRCDRQSAARPETREA
jgi:hypothetical protein